MERAIPACLSDEQRQILAVLLMVNRFARIVPGPGLHRVFRGGPAFGLFLVMLALSAGAAPEFHASLDRDTISFGETAILSMKFTGGSPGGPPNVPPLAGIRLGAEGSSEQMSIIDGEVTSSIVYTLELIPSRPGEFTIPALVADVNGTRLASRPLKLKVVQGNLPQANGAPETAFVRIIPSATNVYLGQEIPVEVACYCQENVANVQIPQLSSDNFIVGNLPNNPGRSRSRQGNAIYTCFNFRVPAMATRTGLQRLGPAVWSMTVGMGQQTFFGGWTGGSHPLSVTSDAPEINVLPIPTNGAPPSFNGAIGDFTLAEFEAGPASVGVGDPITLKIRISGSGSFETLTLPANEQEWREFKTYPPTSKFESTDPLQIQGSKYFEQVITPLNAEIKALPAFALSYFDPATGTFHTLSHPPIPLTVHTTAATPQPTVIASGAPPEEAQQQNQEIVHIKPAQGTLEKSGPPLVQQPLFLALQALPPLVWIGALIWRRQKDKLANNPRLRRLRDVARLVREGLAELPAHAAANNAEKFHSTILRLLREQLGERLDMPAPAITEAVLDELKGLDRASQTLLRELFQACDQYRYTPEHTSQALASLIPKVKTALAALQRMPDPGGTAGKRMLQSVGVVLALLAGAAGARADSASDPFFQANKFYEEAKYSQAAAVYEDLLKAGQVSSAIYFNAGNAWFKTGQIGRAIYDYRRAEQLSPRDPDIRANLEIARARAGTSIAALPGSRWTRWVGRVTLTEWTCAASGAAALFFLVLAARQVSPAFAKSSGGVAFALAAGTIWLLICLGLSIDQQLLEKTSIVIVPEAVVRRGPLEESQSAFTAHDGAEMTVLGRDGDWLQVTDSTRRIGWLQQKDVAQIP
jgi:tetratricopeptide (TPR) repeat protein